MRERWRILSSSVRKWWHETLPMKIARRLPRKVVLWCAIRVGSNATTGQYGTQNVPELSFMDALKRWDDK